MNQSLKKILFTCFIFSFLISSIYAKESVILKYKKSEELLSFSATSKYISATLFNNNKGTYRLLVNSKKGETVFETGELKNYIKYNKIIDESNSLIYITPGVEDTDKIISINLDSQTVNWSTFLQDTIMKCQIAIITC